MNRRLIIIIMTLALFSLYSCDQTDLSGDVLVLYEPLVTDQTIPLILQVPEDLEEIYKVSWSVFLKDHPQDPLDIIIYGENLLDYYSQEELGHIFNLETINYDRIALFNPRAKGIYTIEVHGYYKQTNPQPITHLDITIP